TAAVMQVYSSFVFASWRASSSPCSAMILCASNTHGSGCRRGTSSWRKKMQLGTLDSRHLSLNVMMAKILNKVTNPALYLLCALHRRKQKDPVRIDLLTG